MHRETRATSAKAFCNRERDWRLSSAADERNQGQTMGSVSSLNSLMAVIAPVFGAPLLGLVSHLPAGDWRVGLPMFFCAGLQSLALLFAVLHFRRSPGSASAPAKTA